MKVIIGVLLGFAAGSSVVAGLVIEEKPTSSVELVEPETILIDNEQMLGGCLETIQRQFLPVSIPSLDRWMQPAVTSFPVVWDKFSPTLRKEMRGWIDDYGIVRYTVGLYEDFWTGEIVVINNLGREIYRIKRSKGYDPYDYQRDLFNLGETEVLEDEFTRQVFHPSKISTVVELVPLVFWDSHLQMDAEIAAQEQAAMPMIMAMDASGENSNPTARMEIATNGVNLVLSLPDDFGDHVEIFWRNNLIYDSWAVAKSWIPTYRSTTVEWEDSTAGNTRFYHISNAVDSDGDGYSDLREVWCNSTLSNSFNYVDEDSDGMHDWFEEKMFGNLDEDDSDDSDGDGLLNYEEMEYFSGSPPKITLRSDPSLCDTDADGMNDYEELRIEPITDPWNPDASAPTVAVGSPESGTIITP